MQGNNLNVMIHFHVYMEQPHTHTFRVVMQIPSMQKDVVEIWLPVWTPGSYLIREYSKNINYVHAYDGNGNALSVNKSRKNRWAISTTGSSFRIEYSVYAFEESVRTSWLDINHASIIPASLFFGITGHPMPAVIEFHPHPDFTSIASSLPVWENDPWKRFAEDADTLYDSPIEIGNHSEHVFHAAGIPHQLVISGEGNYNTEVMLRDMQRIIETELLIFQHHPCAAYLVILQTAVSMRGGLEHKDSTSLIFKRNGFGTEEDYNDFISLFAHEYFHLWNVKRLRPKPLGPFDYENENYTTSLWIAEGFTSYYDDLIVYRAGIIPERAFLKITEKNIQTVQNNPGKLVHPIALASQEAWIKYYRQNENSENTQVNYYTQGSVIALLLDLLIIHHSGARYCLDDVMREAYLRFYVNRNTGYTEEEFRAVLEQFAGISLIDFYGKYIFGTEELPIAETLALAGLKAETSQEADPELQAGWTINANNIVTAIRRDSAAEKAGIYVGSEMLAIDGYRYQAGLFSEIYAAHAIGDTITCISAFKGIIKQHTLVLTPTDRQKWHLQKMSEMSATQQRNYAKWLAQRNAETASI